MRSREELAVRLKKVNDRLIELGPYITQQQGYELFAQQEILKWVME